MLHCGAQLKSREEVFAVPLPPATDSYMPLPHESLVTRIEKQLALEGATTREERLALAKEGQRMFGLIQVELPGSPDRPAYAEVSAGRDYGCVLGLRNSYDKSCSAGLCIGATVFVCDNLSFHGSQVTFQRKHTANLLRDLSWIISETVNRLPLLFAEQSKTFEAYRRTELSDRQAHDLVIRCYDGGALNSSDIVPVLREWRSPRHPAFAEGGRTAWRLFNAATETIKGDLWRLPARTRAIHEVLDAECGIAVERKEVEYATAV
jgi:hypothetical protein